MCPAAKSKGRKLALACGSLGGFSGFLHESFRRHDYLLGRRNAQAFLRWHFALPETNPLFAQFEVNRRGDWYIKEPGNEPGSVSPSADPTLSPKLFATTISPASLQEKGLPIIPLTKKMQAPIEIAAKDRPQPRSVSTSALRGLVDARTNLVLSILVDQDLKHLLSLWAPLGLGPSQSCGGVRTSHRHQFGYEAHRSCAGRNRHLIWIVAAGYAGL